MVSLSRLLMTLLDSGSFARVPIRVRIRTLAVIGLVFVILPTSLFLNSVLLRPTRTPLLVLSSTYVPPWDINPWSNENVDAIASLDRRNLSVRRLDDPGDLAIGQWSDFEDEVARMDHFAKAGKPILLYINLHGFVGADLEPYFIVKESIPHEPETWVSIRNLIQHIGNAVRKDRPVVLFLESSRQETLLPDRSMERSFAMALHRMADSMKSTLKAKRISILAPSSSEATVTGGIDLFTSSLVEALRGECDLRSRGGNANREVDLHELTTYIERRLQSSMEGNESRLIAIHDTPRSRNDLSLAWALRSQRAVTQSSPVAVSKETFAEMTEAWQRVEAMRRQKPWNLFPYQWNRLIRYAVSLETAAFGGSACHSLYSELHGSFRQQAKELEEGLAMDQQAMQSWDIDRKLVDEGIQTWDSIAREPSLLHSKQWISQWKNRDGYGLASPVPWLAEAATMEDLMIWKDSEFLKKWANVSSQMERGRRISMDLGYSLFQKDQERELDADRRWLEDWILCGEMGEDFMRRFEGFGRKVAEWHQQMEELAKVIDSQNLVMSEFPTLFRAIDRLDPIDGTTPATLGSLSHTLSDQLRANLNQWRLDIENPNADPSKLRELQSIYSKMRDEVARRWRMVATAGANASHHERRALEELLASGFLPVDGVSIEKGIELRFSSRKLLAARSLQSPKGAAAKNLKVSKSGEEAITKLLLPLSSDVEGTEEQTSPLRHLEKAILETYGASAKSQANDISERHTKVMSARIASSLGYDRASSIIVNRWIEGSRTERLIASSLRIMDDYWNGPRIDANPYFVSVAKQMLSATKQMESGSAENAAAVRSANDRLNASLEARTLGVRFSCQTLPSWNLRQPRELRCVIEPGTRIQDLTPMIARFEVDGIAPSRLKRSPEHFVELSPNLAFREFAIALDESLDRSVDKKETLRKGILKFRGHRLEAPFEMPVRRDNQTTATLTPHGPASILIDDSRTRRRARMLILDCSASMYEGEVIEADQRSIQNSTSTSKLDAARIAVSNILDRWRGGNDWIGVMLYGHRVAAGKPEQGTLYQSRYFAKFPFPQTLRPFEDVETILPVGRFGENEWSSVLQRLELLVPWGQTPLYLAISNAIHELKGLGNGFDQDVIVISDGRNYQFNPTQDKNVPIGQVIQNAKEHGVRIHVIGFGVPKSEMQEAIQQYQRLAEETGGTMTMQVADALQLVENLRSIVKTETYTVTLPNGEGFIGQCGTPLPLMVEGPNTPVRIDFRNQSKILPVHPNAMMHLGIGVDDRLQGIGFTESGIPKSIPLLTPKGTPTPFLLGIHPPRRHDERVDWTLSFQREDGEIAQRPLHLWVEVEPIPVGGSRAQLGENRYVLANGSWLPGTSNPVLRFSTVDWPNDLKEASVEFWCTDQSLDPCATLDIHHQTWQETETVTVQPREQTIEHRIRFQVQREPDGFSIVLFHEDDSDVYDFLPQVQEDPRMCGTDRRYSPKERLSYHRFRFDSNQSERLESDVARQAIRIYRMSKIKEKGLRLQPHTPISLVPEMAILPKSPQPKVVR